MSSKSWYLEGIILVKREDYSSVRLVDDEAVSKYT
jgi:hypothetical protein